MTPTKNIPDKAPSPLGLLLQRLRRRLPPRGFFGLALVLILLSALASTDFSPRKRLFLAGEIATSDVMADRSFLFEDSAAARAKREQAKNLQPLVLDLVTAPIEEQRGEVLSLLQALRETDNAEARDALRRRLAEEWGEDFSLASLTALADPKNQAVITDVLLPLAEKTLREGVLQEMRVILPYKGGAILRNLETGEERLFSDATSLQDLKSLELLVSLAVNQQSLPAQSKRALLQFFSRTLRATLIPNYETTASRAAAAEAAVQPVFLQMQRGEILIRQGDRVTVEQQIKMQSLLNRASSRFNENLFLGMSVCSLLMTLGLLFAPSNKPISPMDTRDYVFLAVLVFLFSLTAKGFSLLALELAANSPAFAVGSLAYAVPVTGAAGLAAMIFTTRRYAVTGLLIAFFCTGMSPAGFSGIGLFLFYFLAYMWNTWLINRTYSRQDLVKSVLPLLAGLFALWLGGTFLQGGPYTRYLPEALSLTAHAILSLLLTLALAPVVELVFNYTSRSRLMELLNLEQPLLRDLMLKAPGTYHHSLIVSNMVEAGAKTVGAYSLLAKVAALYHDIGKTLKASYFIENQNSEENPHDKLAPSMSALILISHVKQGVELATQEHLGREVIDIIRQHHGTGLIQYFYQKALQQTDAVPPKEEDFRYPGPRPQSNEAALIMLADAVEASSRTLEDPTPHRLRQHISTIIKTIYATGQLDETELTFRDLDRLADTFSGVLRGIFHHRVSYPEKGAKEKTEAQKAAPGEEPPAAPFRPWPASLPADASPVPAGSSSKPSYAYTSPSGGTNRDSETAFPPVSALPQ
ncbi:MAG: HDIG domain-containing protein [Desulfovibrio sp.]|jgi:putative nucleotidyltransferase with HDIG domain|nr:HDIG domain-containing protein [Desulfovibrio sp.]